VHRNLLYDTILLDDESRFYPGGSSMTTVPETDEAAIKDVVAPPLWILGTHGA
jgi:hypothetical protein